MKGEVPPATLVVAVPFTAALHSALVDEVEIESVVGCDTIVEEVAVHPFASVTVRE